MLEQNQRMATFSGNVDAVQGDTTCAPTCCASSTPVRRNVGHGQQQTVRLLEAEGNVLITQPGETAAGNTGPTTWPRGKMVLIGDVVLTRGKNVVRATGSTSTAIRACRW